MRFHCNRDSPKSMMARGKRQAYYFERTRYSIEAKVQRLELLKHDQLSAAQFDTCPRWLTTWLLTNTAQIHVRYKKVMATKIQHRSMRRRLKFGHSYQTYNVDLCHIDENMSTTTNTQMWIHARTYTKYFIATWGNQWALLTDTQGLCLVFHKVRFYPCDYNDLMSNMVETTWLSVNDENH